VIPALGRLRQEALVFQPRLGCIVGRTVRNVHVPMAEVQTGGHTHGS
jgi:hypothetical protein